MSELNKQHFVRMLREVADYIESHDFDDDARYYCPTLCLFCDDANQFGRNVAAAGACKKVNDDYFLNATVPIGGNEFVIKVIHESACKRVKVGETVIEAKPERVLPAEPERVEEIFKWECPESFLAMKDTDIEEAVSAESDF